MAKKLKITNEDCELIKEQAIKDFSKLVTELDKTPSKWLETISFVKRYTLTGDNNKRHLFFTPTAYLKMLQYVLQSDKEIAWHGVVERKSKTDFIIKDVFLYPQSVSGVTVETDQTKYTQWTDTLDDDTFNAMRFQGHSHVNMGVTPSAVDTRYYDEQIATLSENDFYIFLVINKKQEIYKLIYDLETNTLYENTDIEVIVLDNDSENLTEDVKASIKEHITSKVYRYEDYQTKRIKDIEKKRTNLTHPIEDDIDIDDPKYEDYLYEQQYLFEKEMERDLPPIK